MAQIRTHAQLERALAKGTFLLFVHSLLCALSVAAFTEYESWASGESETETGWIDADADPMLARSASDRTGVPSACPQAMFLRRGRPSWTATVPDITQSSLRSAFGWPLPSREQAS